MTPKELGFFFPAEWHVHRATWLTFPKNEATWEDRFERIYPAYFEFIKTLTLSERVAINAHSEEVMQKICSLMTQFEVNADKRSIHSLYALT